MAVRAGTRAKGSPWSGGVASPVVDECVAFARTTGARSMVLFTVDALAAARRIYEAAGFTLVESTPSAGWGVPVVEQTWALDLSPER